MSKNFALGFRLANYSCASFRQVQKCQMIEDARSPPGWTDFHFFLLPDALGNHGRFEMSVHVRCYASLVWLVDLVGCLEPFNSSCNTSLEDERSIGSSTEEALTAPTVGNQPLRSARPFPSHAWRHGRAVRAMCHESLAKMRQFEARCLASSAWSLAKL